MTDVQAVSGIVGVLWLLALMFEPEWRALGRWFARRPGDRS